ncbi:Protein unc-93 like protein [Argiope bruennichi]|uniref:Protein unc-93 like protein n=1 Tax=Argiope bruennichi TaxID=94029 RepID=A0A8T0F700_ARGBR|nr:Protein unc-93 like protein [Argiope bruennichi]
MKFPLLHQKSYEAVQSTDSKSARPKIVKNLAALCAGTVMLFTAYDALTMLQSTMNRKDGIGVTSQATLYAFFCGSAVLLPKFFISKFGSKNTSVAAMFAYLPYIASNYYPHWSLMIPSSILLGIAGPLLWSSHGVYLNEMAVIYCSLGEPTGEEGISNTPTKKNTRKTSNDFNPQQKYFVPNKVNDIAKLKYNKTKEAMSLQSCKRLDSTEIGNTSLIRSHSSYVGMENSSSSQPQNNACKVPPSFSNYKDLTTQQNSNNISCEENSGNETKRLVMKTTNTFLSSTSAKFFGFHGMAHLTSHVWSSLLSYFILETDVSLPNFNNSSCRCGSQFCSIVSECFEYNAGNPSENIRTILTSVCVCVCLISILVVAVFLDALDQEKRQIYFSFGFLNATCAILKRNEMLLLIPLSIHTGLVQGFYLGDFNKSYVACAWGTYHVGLVAMCYGVMCGVSSLLSGWWVKSCGRRPVFTLAALLNVTSVLFLLIWTPDSKFSIMFFFASGLWGIHVGIVWSQLRAMLGALFSSEEEAAFSAFHLGSGLGFCIAFGFSDFFCISHKLYVILAVSQRLQDCNVLRFISEEVIETVLRSSHGKGLPNSHFVNMDNVNKETFPKKSMSAPSIKRAQDPEDDDENYKEKKAKMNCDVKPILTKKSVSATCRKMTESAADDEEDYKAQHSNTKEFFTDRDRLKTTPEKFEEKMEEETETDFLKVAHSLLNNILSRFPDYQSNKTASPTATEGSIEDEQWEIIRIPYSSSNRHSNSDDSQNVLNVMKDENDDNVSLAEEMDENELIVDSINNDVLSNSRDLQENDCFAAENIESSLTHPCEFSFTSPEAEMNNYKNTNSFIIPEIKNATDTHFEKQEEIEIQQQFSNSFHDKLDNNTNLDEARSDTKAFGLLLEEIESERFQTGSPMTAGNTRKNDVGKLAFDENTINLMQNNASTVNIISETENNSIQSSINYEELINRIERNSSSHADLNLKRCSHSKQNNDLIIIKNKSKLRIKTRKYCVANSKGHVKNARNEQKPKMQEFLMNTLKDTHPDLHLKDNIALRLEIFLWDILHRIGDEAENLVTLSTKKIFDKRVLKYAIKLSLEKLKTEADVVSGKRNQWLF